jgi:flagellar hook protein FlgE
MGTFNTAISGLNGAAKDLEVIGNNIANSNTVGFKGGRSQFADVFSGLGATATGSGVRLSKVQQSFASGTITPTNNSLDLAIQGSGFFILSNQGAAAYTRAGQFSIDENNVIVNPQGMTLQGKMYPAGVLSAVATDITIDRSNIQPQATTTASIGLNLNSSVGSVAGTTDPELMYATTAWSNNPVPPASALATSYNNVAPMTVYDSLGNAHTLSTHFIKADPTGAPGVSGADGDWYVAFKLDGVNVDIPPVVLGQNNSACLNALRFDSSGQLQGILPAGGGALGGNTMTVTTNDIPMVGTNLSVTIDFSNVTQYGSPFAVQSTTQDGYTTGGLIGLQINNTGLLQGRYSNGQVRDMAVIQLANFANYEGLQNSGDTTWVETQDSGQPLVADAGSAGIGLISSGALEESNVDLTAQLVALINAQRNFQANAQTIKTGDAITQTIINLR